MVSTHLIVSRSCPFTNPTVTVPRAPITIDINVTFMLHNFFQFPSRVLVIILLFVFFQFHSVVSRNSKVHNLASSHFLFCWLLPGLVVWPRLGDLFVSQNPRGFCTSHSPGQILGCAYTICSYRQTSIFCTIPNGTPCPPNHVWSYIIIITH